MNAKGPVKIKPAITEISSKERIFRLVQQNPSGIDNASLKKTTGITQGTISSSLSALEKAGKVHKKKKIGKKGYTYFPGNKEEQLPTSIQAIRKVAGTMKDRVNEFSGTFSQLIAALNEAEHIVLFYEKKNKHLTDELTYQKEKYKQLEYEHLNLLEKLENLLDK